MSGKNGGSADTARSVFRVILIFVIGLALAGAFNAGLKPVRSVSVPGLALMILGIAAAFAAKPVADRIAGPDPERAALFIRLAGVLLCGIGAIVIICL